MAKCHDSPIGKSAARQVWKPALRARRIPLITAKDQIALLSLCLVLFGASPGAAQSNTTPKNPNWGKDIQGVQLSINMTNNVVERGLTFTMVALITNSATNAIVFGHRSAETDFDVSLTNASGKLYHLTPRWLGRSSGSATIESRVQVQLTIPVTIGKDIEPGNYTINASRVFSVRGTPYNFLTLESNPLQVQIK
jgi:hypothetical protein